MTENHETDPDLSAEIAAEAESPDKSKPQKPHGAPGFKPLTAVRRRVRADFQSTLYRGLPSELLSQAESGDGTFDISTPGMLEFALQYTANLEDAYAMIAFDREAYEAWVVKCSDDDLHALHDWYQEKYPLGEVSASQNS